MKTGEERQVSEKREFDMFVLGRIKSFCFSLIREYEDILDIFILS